MASFLYEGSDFARIKIALNIPMNTKLSHKQKAAIYKSVAGSSKLEGIDFEAAIKNKELIKRIKKHGGTITI